MNENNFTKLMPTFLTIVNMLLGLTAILLLLGTDMPGKVMIAVSLILLGGVADFFDGYTARKLDRITDMGKQLDSFADIITFGIAPICLVNYLLMESGGFVTIWAASVIFVLAGAYRLARYNLNDFRDYFMGLPITVAGVLLAIVCAIYPIGLIYHYPGISTGIIAMLMTFLAMAMVSKVKIKRRF